MLQFHVYEYLHIRKSFRKLWQKKVKHAMHCSAALHSRLTFEWTFSYVPKSQRRLKKSSHQKSNGTSSLASHRLIWNPKPSPRVVYKPSSGGCCNGLMFITNHIWVSIGTYVLCTWKLDSKRVRLRDYQCSASDMFEALTPPHVTKSCAKKKKSKTKTKVLRYVHSFEGYESRRRDPVPPHRFWIAIVPT